MAHSGDGGLTSHLREGRISKGSAPICALGEIDELNVFIGQLVAGLPTSCQDLAPALLQVQRTLFKTGCVLAAAGTGEQAHAEARNAVAGLVEAGADRGRRSRLQADAEALTTALADVERWAQAWRDEVGELRHFIVPGGHAAACAAHVARAVCRRAERTVAALGEPSENAGSDELAGVLRYLNRLSDALFEAARVINSREKTPELEARLEAGLEKL